ncbi:S9 family peptidase [Sphingomonas sp.]|uniref:alpha/beta hydrolase family protein n=1 Tax=Sphingomonas sp. TaxID=28214 RepID=UPI001B131478|nr:S9 family peptidase [Sphingomonas sp.]MBO9715188.1 S9 family peptidase [Sphingomonas sp.]
MALGLPGAAMIVRMVMALALASVGVIGQAWAADGPTTTAGAAELVAPAAYQTPALSPDGRRVALIAPHPDGSRLMLADADHPATMRPIALAHGQDAEWVRWAGDAKLLLGVHVPGTAAPRLLLVDPATGSRTLLGGKEALGDDVIHLDPKGRFALLSVPGAHDGPPAVWRVDLASGSAARVVAPRKGVREWVADSAGVVRAGIESEGRHRWLLYRAADGEDFRRAARSGASNERDVDAIVPVAGSSLGYAIAAAPDGRYALFRYDLATDRLGELVYANKSVDLDGFQVSAEGVPLGVGYTDDRERSLWFDAGLRAVQAKLDAERPESINRIVSISADRQRLLVWRTAPDQPGSYWLYDTASGTAHALADAYPLLAGKRFSATRSVSYKARDGLAIPAYLTLPAGRAAKDLPLIVMVHGGPYARDDWSYDPWVQYLAGKGYAVLQPNYRGSTGFGREFEDAGDGQWGRGMQDDADDGARWLAQQGVADGKRICIMGASYGGYAAMWAAAHDTHVYRCAISFAGISDIDAQLRFDAPTFPSRAELKGWRARIQGKARSLQSLSPLHFAADVRMPLMIAHGTEDGTVPVTQSIAMHDALQKLGRAHDFVLYPGEDHGLDGPANAADFLDRVGAFLDRFNPN